MHGLLSNKKSPLRSGPHALAAGHFKKNESPLRAGPHMPAAGCQKNPTQGWPSHALCWVPEKYLTRAISLVPLLPDSLSIWSRLGSYNPNSHTTSVPGSHRDRPKRSKTASGPDSCGWTTRRGGDKTRAEPQGQDD